MCELRMKNFKAKAARQGGFTLVELMIVVVIVAIVLTIAVPGFRDVLLRNRMAGKLNELVAAMQMARSEAIKNNMNAVFCKSTNGTSCNGIATDSWSEGWLVWLNTDGDTNVDADEIVGSGGSTDDFAFVGDGDGTTTDIHSLARIEFRADGAAIVGGVPGSGTLKLCIDQQLAGLISLDLTGRPVARKLPSAAGCP